MNLDQYQNIVEYLDSDKLPLDLNDIEQQTIIKRAKFFFFFFEVKFCPYLY
jgi:hypothetical protein